MQRPLPLALLFLLAGLLAGCPDQGSSGEASTGETETSASPSRDEKLQDILGALALVREEYVDAVRDGAIIDETEYMESELFIDQAIGRYEQIAAEIQSEDTASHQTIQENLKQIADLIAKKGDVDRVVNLVQSTLGILEGFLSESAPPAVRGALKADQLADATVLAEKEVSPWRVGIFVVPGRDYTLLQGPEPTPVKAAENEHFVGIVLREATSKRFLPKASVQLSIGDKTVDLHELWGEFPHYGANVALPEGSLSVEVDVDPPAYCRHGDYLSVYIDPVSASFTLKRSDEGWTAERAGPVATEPAGDYRTGDDILQALGEALKKGEVGPYRFGFIAEVPEPLWIWRENGKPELQAVKETDTHHLEIWLLDQESGQLVTGADVTLDLAPADGGEPLHIPLYPLLSAFHHYGETLRVPEGTYEVTVTVKPPTMGYLNRDPLPEATATFSWKNEAKKSEDDAQ